MLEFTGFVLCEEYLNSDFGSRPKDMYDMLKIFLTKQHKNLFDDIDIFFDERRIGYKPDEDKYNLYNISSESHSTYLMIFGHETKINVCYINSGYGAEHNDDKIIVHKIFTIKTSEKLDEILKRIYNYLFVDKKIAQNTVEYIYKIINSLDSYIDVLDDIAEHIIDYKNNIEINDVLNISHQISGSCSYYSCLYSLYVINYLNKIHKNIEYFDNTQIVEFMKNKILNNMKIESVQKRNGRVGSDENYIEKNITVKIPEENIDENIKINKISHELLKILSVKYSEQLSFLSDELQNIDDEIYNLNSNLYAFLNPNQTNEFINIDIDIGEFNYDDLNVKSITYFEKLSDKQKNIFCEKKYQIVIKALDEKIKINMPLFLFIMKSFVSGKQKIYDDVILYNFMYNVIVNKLLNYTMVKHKIQYEIKYIIDIIEIMKTKNFIINKNYILSFILFIIVELVDNNYKDNYTKKNNEHDYTINKRNGYICSKLNKFKFPSCEMYSDILNYIYKYNELILFNYKDELCAKINQEIPNLHSLIYLLLNSDDENIMFINEIYVIPKNAIRMLDDNDGYNPDLSEYYYIKPKKNFYFRLNFQPIFLGKNNVYLFKSLDVKNIIENEQNKLKYDFDDYNFIEQKYINKDELENFPRLLIRNYKEPLIKEMHNKYNFTNPFDLNAINEEELRILLSEYDGLYPYVKIKDAILLDTNVGINIVSGDNFYEYSKKLFYDSYIKVNIEKKVNNNEYNINNIALIYAYYLFFNLNTTNENTEYINQELLKKFLREKDYYFVNLISSKKYYKSLINKNIDINNNLLTQLEFTHLKIKDIEEIIKINKSEWIIDKIYELKKEYKFIDTDVNFFDIEHCVFEKDEIYYFYFENFSTMIKKKSESQYKLELDENYIFDSEINAKDKNIVFKNDNRKRSYFEIHDIDNKNNYFYLEYVDDMLDNVCGNKNIKENILNINITNEIGNRTNEIIFFCSGKNTNHNKLILNKNNSTNLYAFDFNNYMFGEHNQNDIFRLEEMKNYWLKIIGNNNNFYAEYDVINNKILCNSEKKSLYLLHFLRFGNNYDLIENNLNQFLHYLDVNIIIFYLGGIRYNQIFNHLIQMYNFDMYGPIRKLVTKNKKKYEILIRNKHEKINLINTDDKLNLNLNLNFRENQKECVDDIIEKIISGKNLNYIYELLMGFGKTSIIIPYICLKTISMLNYDVIFIVTKSSLLEQTTSELMEKTHNMHPIIIKKITSNKDINMIEKIKQGIIVISDDVFKYCLLNKQTSDILINVELSKKRLLLIDEIDSCVNPLESNYNLKMGDYTKNISENKYFDSLTEIIIKMCDIVINKKDDLISTSIQQIIKDNFEDIFENLNECTEYFFENFDNKEEIEKCDKKEIKNIVNAYIIKKILNCFSVLKAYIYNKHYGLSDLKTDKNYYYAMPYDNLKQPKYGSDFNDMILVLFLTGMIFLHNLKKLRQSDIENLCYKYNQRKLKVFIDTIDNISQEDKITYYNQIHSNISDYIVTYNIDKFNNLMKNNVLGNIIKKYYLKHIVFPSIDFCEKYKNTSFVELLHPYISNKFIGFTGTVEYIPKVDFSTHLQKFPPVYSDKYNIDRELHLYENIITDFSSREKDMIYIKQKLFDRKQNVIFIEHNITEKKRFSIVKQLLRKNSKYNGFIDVGCMLREYSVMYYVKKFYGLYNKKKIIVFFDDNGDKCYYDGTINYILQKDEIEKMRKNDYFIFFDNKRTRGTDISLPQCYALCSISIINNSVDVMQGIFRLRKIAKENTHNQTCDFLISDDIKTDVETFSLYTYLNKRTELYIKDQYSELLIQLLNTSIKFKSNTYELKEINQNFIPNFNDSKLENLYVDYDLENKLNVINCNVSNKIIVNYCEEITKLKTRRNIKTHELTSISESKQLNSLMQSSTSTQISTQKNISATQIYKEHDYYLHKKRITYPNDIINLYDYDDRKVSLYERYIYSFDYKNIKISQNFVNSIFYSFLIFPKDVELLFENFNIDANKEDDKGKTMLFYTIINKHNYFFDYLLNMQNIDVNKKIDGESYLHLILQYPMKYIQENINITSLTDEIVDRINDDYYSMFLHITKHQNININIKDKHENTPLHTILKNYSEYRNYDYIGNILENKKIHINITDNDGNSCLHIAAKKDFISEIKRFVNIKSINIDQQNKLRETPFHIAIKDNNIELINYFLIFKNKININNVDINNNAILHSIIQNCNEEVLKHVLKYNPKINVRNNNDETPLDLAINTNEEKIALLLLKNDAKFDLKNKNGDTSLHFAIKKKLYKFIKECVRMLSVRNMMITDKKKNDLIFMNNDKKTPLTCAKENTEKNEVDTKIIYLLEQIFEK